MQGDMPICVECKHYHEENNDFFSCDAFPHGIPDDILEGKEEHYDPFPGDNGIQFEEK